jgi:hypothetical protein
VKRKTLALLEKFSFALFEALNDAGYKTDDAHKWGKMVTTGDECVGAWASRQAQQS